MKIFYVINILLNTSKNIIILNKKTGFGKINELKNQIQIKIIQPIEKRREVVKIFDTC